MLRDGGDYVINGRKWWITGSAPKSRSPRPFESAPCPSLHADVAAPERALR
jgi:hypothetical protein